MRLQPVRLPQALHGALDGLEEANELLVAMPSHAASDHGSVEDIERGEQSGRAVALDFDWRRSRFRNDVPS